MYRGGKSGIACFLSIIIRHAPIDKCLDLTRVNLKLLSLKWSYPLSIRALIRAYQLSRSKILGINDLTDLEELLSLSRFFSLFNFYITSDRIQFGEIFVSFLCCVALHYYGVGIFLLFYQPSSVNL